MYAHTQKNLGIIISSDLSWDKRYDYIISEACKVFGIRRTVNNYHYPLIKENFTRCLFDPNSLVIHSYVIYM